MTESPERALIRKLLAVLPAEFEGEPRAAVAAQARALLAQPDPGTNALAQLEEPCPHHALSGRPGESVFRIKRVSCPQCVREIVRRPQPNHTAAVIAAARAVARSESGTPISWALSQPPPFLPTAVSMTSLATLRDTLHAYDAARGAERKA